MHEFQVQIHELQVLIHELRVQTHKLLVQIIYSMKTHVDCIRISSFPKILSLKLFDNLFVRQLVRSI